MIAPAGQVAGDVGYVDALRRELPWEPGRQRGRADGLHVRRVRATGSRCGRQVFDVREERDGGRYHDAVEPRGDSHGRDAGSVGAHHPESRAGTD